MVIDHSAGLQVGIDRDRADILKAAFFQVPADSVRQTVADRDPALRVSFINDAFSFRIGPQVIAEAAKFCADFLITLGVVDDSPYLALRFQHSFRAQNALHILFCIGRNPVIFKVVKTCPEDLPLFQHQPPAETALQIFQCQEFKHLPVIMDRDSPFRIMVRSVPFRGIRPAAMSHTHILSKLSLTIA